MDVITTHLNADFDALGSMIAAKKLYPSAVLVFPGSQERSLRRFFLESAFYLAPFEKVGRIDPRQVRRLILVDVRQKDRLGKFAEIVDSPGVEVHIYDHHPGTADDIRGSLEYCRPAGATVTLLVEVLRWASVPLSPEEATILILGIYEDTGSLTFRSTTPEDLEAAAYLIRQGADLNAVPGLITAELTQDQLSLLHDLVRSRKTYSFGGLEVSLAEASADGYVGDLAVLVHKLRDLENLNVLFVLVRMEDRVFLVARSRIDEVDVGEIAREFGGGGHPTAASATIKNLTLIQVRQRLLMLLGDRVTESREVKKVRDYMSYPAICLQAGDTVKKAQDTLNRYNVNGFPVLDRERLCGIISRQVIEKAAHHGLEARKVAEVMSSDCAVLSVDDPMNKAQDLLLGSRQRFIPAMEGNKVSGVLTRMDVIRYLASRLPEPAARRSATDGSAPGSHKRLGRLMAERLPARVLTLLRDLGENAHSEGMQAYLVGGVVRDLLLRRENLDVDIVVEGDGILLAEKICERHQARKQSHSRFGTASVLFPEGYRFDVATARLEYYKEPAALPTVEWSSLKLDLYRRDFTMNTLAIRLNPDRFGELVDYFDGQKDIKDRVIRVIQNLSFIEDPTRIFRALRFAERFGFALGTQTKALMQNAIEQGLPSKLDGRRLFVELRQILGEGNPAPVLVRLQKLDLMGFIYPRLTLDGRLENLFDQAREVLSWYRLLYLREPVEEWLFHFLCLVAFLRDEEVAAVSKRLGIRAKKATSRLAGKSTAEGVLRKMAGTRRELRASEIYRLLNGLPIEVLLYAMARTSRERTRMAISVYITRLRATRISVAGTDLKAMGYEEGPRFKEILGSVLEAKLDGAVRELEDEKEWIKRNFPLH